MYLNNACAIDKSALKWACFIINNIQGQLQSEISSVMDCDTGNTGVNKVVKFLDMVFEKYSASIDNAWKPCCSCIEVFTCLQVH